MTYQFVYKDFRSYPVETSKRSDFAQAGNQLDSSAETSAEIQEEKHDLYNTTQIQTWEDESGAYIAGPGRVFRNSGLEIKNDVTAHIEAAGTLMPLGEHDGAIRVPESASKP